MPTQSSSHTTCAPKPRALVPHACPVITFNVLQWLQRQDLAQQLAAPRDCGDGDVNLETVARPQPHARLVLVVIVICGGAACCRVCMGRVHGWHLRAIARRRRSLRRRFCWRRRMRAHTLAHARRLCTPPPKRLRCATQRARLTPASAAPTGACALVAALRTADRRAVIRRRASSSFAVSADARPPAPRVVSGAPDVHASAATSTR